jgi:hypothetical protein
MHHLRGRVYRVLVAAGVLASVVGLWPSPAQAKITCRIQDIRACGRYICCIESCIYCYDSITLELVGDIVCSDPTCWERNY